MGNLNLLAHPSSIPSQHLQVPKVSIAEHFRPIFILESWEGVWGMQLTPYSLQKHKASLKTLNPLKIKPNVPEVGVLTYKMDYF